MIKKTLAALSLLLFTGVAGAQEKNAVFEKPKFGGYFIGQYQYSDQEDNESNTFNFRYLRLYASGRIMKDFFWKIQGQANGQTSTLGKSPRIVDVFAEWQKYDFLRIKVGQFKNPFTFENPIHPITQGFMGYGQIVSKLAGMGDRSGQHASNGRDIGIQLQGDFLKNSNGRNLVHYQIGVFNGSGINTKDVDNQKNLIGGVWVMPVKGMRIGAFGWTGSYARKGTWTDEEGVNHNGVRSLNQNRYAFSAEYITDDWTFRSEYVHSTGKAFAKKDEGNGEAKDLTINESIGDKADGFYALCIAPVIKNKLHAKVRYDLYRKAAEWNTSRTQYEVGVDYMVNKYLQFNLEYALINDRSLAEHNYNFVEAAMSVKF